MHERRPDTYRLISADSHVNEPPDLWATRVPARYRDRAPRIERFDEGDAWVLEGVADPITFGMNACAGIEPEQMRGWVRFEDIRAGGYDPAARLVEIDRDGVDAEVLYPTPRLNAAIVANHDAEYRQQRTKLVLPQGVQPHAQVFENVALEEFHEITLPRINADSTDQSKAFINFLSF